MPYRSVEAEPIRIRMQASRFANRDASRMERVDGPWRAESTAIRCGTSPERVAHAVVRKSEKAAYPLHLAGWGLAKTLDGQRRVLGTQAPSEQVRVVPSRMREVVTIDNFPAQGPRILRSSGEVDPQFVA